MLDSDLLVSISSNLTAFENGVGEILYSKSVDFYTSFTFYIEMEKGNYSTDFLVLVIGSPDALYQMVMTTPGGTEYTSYISANSDTFTKIANLFHAPKGLYSFEIKLIKGDETVRSHVLVEICD